MELYLRWLDKHERREGEESPLGLILCSEKDQEQIELLQLDGGDVRVVGLFCQHFTTGFTMRVPPLPAGSANLLAPKHCLQPGFAGLSLAVLRR